MIIRVIRLTPTIDPMFGNGVSNSGGRGRSAPTGDLRWGDTIISILYNKEVRALVWGCIPLWFAVYLCRGYYYV